MKLKWNGQELTKQVKEHIPKIKPPTPRVIMVDSENMGDIWGALLERMTVWDKLVVFYTKNSNHMACESTIQFLKHHRKRMEWIPCVEGANALDFQLITELGARISRDKWTEYIIISKDKGYDAAVDYWTKRGRRIRRTGDVPALPSSKQKKKKKKKEKADTYTQLPAAEKKLVGEVCKAVHVDDKSLLFLALTHLMAADTGKRIYKAVKKDVTGTVPLREVYLSEPEQRVRHYLGLMYQKKDCDLGRMYEIYNLSKTMPAQELYEAMKAEFGKNRGATLYQVLKTNLLVLTQIEKQKESTAAAADGAAQ